MYEAICKCINKPPKGCFEKGKEYEYIVTMRGASVIDENERRWTFSELEHKIYFEEIK